MREGSLAKGIRTYILLGASWCLMTNLIAALNGATTPLAVAAGGTAGGSKVIAVAVGIGRQVLLWPLEVWEKVLRPLFG